MHAESFPVLPAGDGTSDPVHRDLLRYRVFHVTPDGTAGTTVAIPVGGSFESRHAAVATAQGYARMRRAT